MTAAVSAERWLAIRALREGEPPTFERLAGAAGLHPVTIRQRALTDSWAKQHLPRAGSRAVRKPAAPVDEDAVAEAALLSTDELRRRLPLSPVHLSGRLQPNGDFAVSWIRRGRIAADDWRPAEIPLGEESEAYSVAVGPVGGEPVRTTTVGTPSWTYEAAALAEDFPQMPEAIEVTVRQISVAVGPGISASAALPLA